MERSRYAELFRSESREHISRINDLLLSLEASAGDLAPVEELFRSVHTLKGMSAAMGYRRATDVAHAMEHLLDQLRHGTLAVDEQLTDALFQGVDALERAIGAEAAGPAPAAPQVSLAEEVDDPGLRVSVTIRAGAALPAVRATLVLRRARELGVVSYVEPAEERLTAGDFGGMLRFHLQTDTAPEDVRAAMLGAGDVAHATVEEGAAEAAEADAVEGAGRTGAGIVRIQQERLDALVNEVGELVVARDRVRRLVESREDPELADAVEQISRMVAAVRDEAMRMRMVPVGEAFERFPRLVRDAARGLGKQVELSVRGRDVALDRALLNELGDLLVHLLRNAVDHGIEAPDERAAAGKPERGALRLSAGRDRSQVVVRVEDDGRGIDRARVLEIARRRGWLAAAGAGEVPDEEIFQLITRPGFSTAREVTDVSGRGVGLDAVRSRAHALGGALEVESEAGRGTRFTLRLPLSLAIVRVLAVSVGGETYLVPLASVAEVAELGSDEVRPSAEGEAMALREEQVPLLRLAAVLAPGAASRPGPLLPVVVTATGEQRLGLAVDALLGQHEAVLKPFDPAAGTLPLFAGATLLSDGRPALILDVPRLSAWWAAGSHSTTRAETLC